MIDLHNHLLPGLDDGPAISPGRSRWPPPPLPPESPRWPAPPRRGQVPQPGERDPPAVARLRAREPQAGRDPAGHRVRCRDLHGRDRPSRRRRAAPLSLNDSGWLLVKAPFAGWPVRLPKLVGELEIRGFRVLFAHPERAGGDPAQPRSPARPRRTRRPRAEQRVEPARRPRRLVTKTVESLLRNGLIHILASDAHSATWRPPGSEGQRVAARGCSASGPRTWTGWSTRARADPRRRARATAAACPAARPHRPANAVPRAAGLAVEAGPGRLPSRARCEGAGGDAILPSPHGVGDVQASRAAINPGGGGRPQASRPPLPGATRWLGCARSHRTLRGSGAPIRATDRQSRPWGPMRGRQGPGTGCRGGSGRVGARSFLDVVQCPTLRDDSPRRVPEKCRGRRPPRRAQRSWQRAGNASSRTDGGRARTAPAVCLVASGLRVGVRIARPLHPDDGRHH